MEFMEKTTEINDKLTKALKDIADEYGVSWKEFGWDYERWTGEYIEDPLSRMSKIIAEKSNKT